MVCINEARHKLDIEAINKNGQTVFDVHETFCDNFILFDGIEDLFSDFYKCL